MICITICDFGYEACRHALKRCEKYQHTYPDIMAEIRLDLCGLTEEETQRLFCESNIPLIATCRRRSRNLYLPAVLSGAAYVDIDGIQADSQIRETIKVFEGHKVKKILSYQNYQKTPTLKELELYFQNGVSHGADIVRITATAQSSEEAERILSLYRLQRQGILDRNVKLVAYGMGYAGSYSAVEACSMGSEFLFCTLNDRNLLYPGMLSLESYEKLHLNDTVCGSVDIPGSKDISQKSILSALLATGESVISNFSTCRDTEAALAMARKRSQKVTLRDGELYIIGQGMKKKPTEKKNVGYLSSFKSLLSGTTNDISFEDTNFVGESGLLARLCIPLVAQVGHQVTVTGEGSLLDREMSGCKETLEMFGANCVLTSDDTLPAIINGPLVGSDVTISAKDGTQLVSGLIMALPLSKKDSILRVTDIVNLSNLLQTVDIVRKFGIELDINVNENSALLNIPGRQKYSPCSIKLEGDWSTAANFIAAAAIFGHLSLTGLDAKSTQADRVILDIVKNMGASVRVGKKNIEISRGHLVCFDFDSTRTPDLFPILAVLAAYSEGTSVIRGLDRIKYRQTKRIETVCAGLKRMGVPVDISDNQVSIKGMCITRRIIEKSLLRGGDVVSNGDHRAAMALRIAGLHTQEKISVADMDCVNKSYPLFKDTLDSITKGK